MIPNRIEGMTRNLGAPANWDEAKDGPCVGLPIRDVVYDNLPAMLSSWQPTPEELAAIVAGAPIILRVVGYAHPPVWLAVGDVP